MRVALVLGKLSGRFHSGKIVNATGQSRLLFFYLLLYLIRNRTVTRSEYIGHCKLLQNRSLYLLVWLVRNLRWVLGRNQNI